MSCGQAVNFDAEPNEHVIRHWFRVSLAGVVARRLFLVRFLVRS